MARTTSTIEIVITVRAWLSVLGKSSRRKPSANVRTIAHTAAAPPKNQNGFTRATLPNGRRWARHGSNPCRRMREGVAMLAAGRGARAVRTRLRALTAAAGGVVARGLRRALNGAPDDPEEPRDGDLEDEHHPYEDPSQAGRWYPGTSASNRLPGGEVAGPYIRRKFVRFTQ